MCGFAGVLRWEGLRPEDGANVRAAAALLAHRGPDSEGFWQDAEAALGFRRLKIIDLSPAGEQPMANEDGSLRVVFNGEIYNFRELRETLRAEGHVFRSQSDTEVLLHGYEQYGEELPERLRGMFAFALWDARARRLLLARDPLGVKPLYFAERAGGVLFASEAKALFALGVKPELDPVALDEALAYRFVPAPRTGFKDVEKLPPGHLAIAEGGVLRYSRWHRMKLQAAGSARTAPHAAETIERIADATRRRMVADVPLGAWLSGGIDSALVLSRMPPGTGAFTAGFAQPEYDERELARLAAAQFQAAHTAFEIPADVFSLLPQIVWHCDEPYFDSSCLPVFVLARQTRAHATVVLSGDGGDEVFAGYDRYAGLQLLPRYARIPGMLRRGALAYARWRHPVSSRQGWDRMLLWLEQARQTRAAGRHPYLPAMLLFSDAQRQALYGEALREAADGCDAGECLEGILLRAREAEAAFRQQPVSDSAPAVLQRADLEFYLPGDVLHKVDRMSMAHGLEVRSPFLDVDLQAWALALPDGVRLPGFRTKPLLREAARALLPAKLAQARKRGFGVPLNEWFRGPLRASALEIFTQSRLAADGWLAPRYWEPCWLAHQQGAAQHGERLYALLALELWYRTFLSGKAAP